MRRPIPQAWPVIGYTAAIVVLAALVFGASLWLKLSASPEPPHAATEALQFWWRDLLRFGTPVAVFAGLTLVLGTILALRVGQQARTGADHRRHDALMAEILSAAGEAIVTVDSRLRIAVFNPEAERIFGYAASEVLGQPLDILLPDDMRAPHRDLVTKFAHGPTKRHLMSGRPTIRGRRKDGSLFPAEATISKLATSNGGVLIAILRDISERERLMREVQLSEERFRSIIEAMPFGLIITTVDDGTIRFANANAGRIAGVAAEDLAGRKVTDFYADPSFRRQLLDGLKHDGEMIGYELCTRRGNGNPGPWLMAASRVTTFAGANVVVSGFYDITEKKATEAALLGSRASLVSAQRIAKLGSWDWDIETDSFAWSDEIYRIFGLRPGQIAATREAFLQSIHPDDRATVEDALRRALRSHEAYEIDHRIVRPSGEVRFVHEQGEVRFDADAHPVHVSGTMHDVTEQRAAIAQRLEMERRFRATFDQAAVGIAHVGQDGSFLRVNRKLCAILGYAEDELSRLRIQDVVHADDLPAALDSARGILSGAIETRTMEIRCAKRAGMAVWTNLTVSLVRAADAEKSYFIAVLEDISQRKSAERALKTAKVEADAANRAKSQFLANMSHELRTPLNAIIGFADIMGKEMYGPLGDRRYREYPHFIVNSGEHLLNIINDILDLSRIEAGTIQPHFAPATVSAEVAQCVEMVHERTAINKLNLVVNGDSASVIVCDRRLLRQIVLNLLSNAIKFTPPGGTITVSWGTDAGEFVLSVADTGIGIAEEDIGRVVDPFTQVDSGLTRQHDGVGLGLSIVKAFAEAQGATMHIDSAPGRGTVVSIRFRQSPQPEKTVRAAGF